MSFSENGLTWPFYLFIYIFLPPPQPVPVKEGPRYHGIGRDGHTPLKYTAKQNAFQSTSMTPPPPRSFSLVIHKSAKCPFQAAHKHPHRSPKMPPHSEARAVDGSEPTAARLPTVRKWWMSEWMCTLQSAKQGRWIWVEVSKWAGKVMNHRGNCKCYFLVWPKNFIKCVCC